MPAIYIVVYYRAGLYADFGINIYYLIIAAYGWFVWKFGRNNTKQQELPNSYFPKRFLSGSIVIFTLLFIGIAQILIHFTDSDVAWLASFTPAFSIICTWMPAR